MRFMLKELEASLGKAPGELVYVGQKDVAPTRIHLFAFGPETCVEQELPDAEACREWLARKTGVVWIDVSGLADATVVARLGEMLAIHPLVLANVLNTGMRPCMEDSGETLFMMLKMLHDRPDVAGEGLVYEQVSLVLGRNWVISFQEAAGDCFDPIRERIRQGTGRVRKKGADYLALLLVDAIVDNYFRVLDPMAETIEDLQERALTDGDSDFLRTTHSLRREIIHLRMNLNPVREWLLALDHADSALIPKSQKHYWRDVHDHCIHVVELLDSMREMLGSVLDLHLTSINNRLSDVMRVLTVITTIFMPLGLITGFFGMNFSHLPGLGWRYAFPALVVVMLGLAGGMLLFFRRRRWI